MKGTVKWFNEAKGFGFITKDGGPDHLKLQKGFGFITKDDGGDVFLHATAFNPYRARPSLTAAGDRLEFEVVRTSRGESARDVVRADDSPFVAVRAGDCATRTGHRVWVRPVDRVAVATVDHGYAPHRGSVALIKRGTVVLQARWGHGQDPTPKWVAWDYDPSNPYGEPAALPPPPDWTEEEIGLAWDWCEAGRTGGRQPSYWP